MLADHFADLRGGGLAGGGGLIEIAVDESRTESGKHGTGLRSSGTEAHDRNIPVGMIDKNGGELLQIAPGFDLRGDLEDGLRLGIVGIHPGGHLGSGGRFLDGVRGENDGFFEPAGLVNDGRHREDGGEFDVDGLDFREKAKVEITALRDFPRPTATFSGNTERQEDGMLSSLERSCDFLHGYFFRKECIDANFDDVGRNCGAHQGA